MTYSDIFLSIKNRPECDWSKVEGDGHVVEWYVREWDNFNVLAFQESNGKEDWKDNFDIKPNTCTCCSGTVVMSEGTNAAFKVAREKIHAEVDQKMGNGNRWIVAGWSLGGGMAVRGVIDMNHHYGIQSNLITFGAPKVLWTQDSVVHTATCCYEIHQFAHRSDPVTKVAPMAKHVSPTWVGVWFPFAEVGVYGWHTNYDKWCAKFGEVNKVVA